MFVRTTLGSSPTSTMPDHTPSPDQSVSPSPTLLPQSPTCWATQAGHNLSQAEAELRCLQERHATETDSVKRSLERAILGARREERRLLERVEQDHRDTQQHLEQIQRDNMTAVQVSQSLLDTRIQKLAQLQQQIVEVGKQSGLHESGPNQNLLKEITEFIQPWEISLSLKKVNFKPSSQTNAITFGDIRLLEQNLSLSVGGFGPQGQPCALHSHEVQCKDMNRQDTGGEKNTVEQGWTSPTGRVLRKINISTQSDLEPEEELKDSSTKIHHWLPKCEQSEWESCQDDEMMESASFPSQQEDVFLAVPTVLKNMDTEGKEQGYKMNSYGKLYSPMNQRKSMTEVSGRKSSPSPERRWEHAKVSLCSSQDGDKGRQCSNVITSPSMSSREPLTTSRSCLDLTSRAQTHSCLSQSSDDHSLGTHGDSGRALSPADSLDSSYTFIVSPSNDYNTSKGSLNYSYHLSKSAVDLTHRTRPLIGGATREQAGGWRLKSGNFNSTSNSASTSPILSRGQRFADIGQRVSYPSYRNHNVLQHQQKSITATSQKQPLASRSLSMSVIDRFSPEPRRDRGEPTLVGLKEEEDLNVTEINHRGIPLIRQFGKQGSGRADFTLPSGIHATPQGQLFIADCGNARVQVTDPRGNVLQQVTSPNFNGSGRRSRNYFDLAVNSKGLIALSCAAERALLVFNRHGRLLQTFGGSGLSSAKDELEAPRGVTVTRLDEFLVADIRKGTLIAIKLEPKTGSRLERTVVTGFHRPYLVAACLSSGMIAVSERGNETGRVPCIKVLEPGWNTVRVLGVCAGMGPVLSCPWGICVDTDGNVLVADWGEEHRVLLYPAQGVGWPIVTQGLSSPRGLTLLPESQLVVSDSMHHCIKIYQYKDTQY